MRKIEIEIMGAPVGKGRPRISTVHGRPVAFTPANTRKYESLIKHEAKLAMGADNPIDGPVAIKVVAALPVPRSWSKKKQAAALRGEIHPGSRPDLDNYVKIALDGLNEIVFRDDSLIVHILAAKVYSQKPRLGITVMAP